MGRFRSSSHTRNEHWKGKHRFEHWYRDNSVYFDGCLRDEAQCRRAYQYTLTQCRRHGICADYMQYPHTRVKLDVDRGIRRALELNAFMTGVRYPRYER